MKLTAAQKLPIYKRALEKYEAAQDPRVEVQRRLVKCLEEECKRDEPHR